MRPIFPMLLRVMTVVSALALGACGPPDDQRTDTVDPEDTPRNEISAAGVAQLDSGNAAYSAAAYEAALRHYRAVTESDPEQATGWFGVYMAQHALGRIDEANEALERARSLAPGASLVRPDSLDPDTTSTGAAGEGGGS